MNKKGKNIRLGITLTPEEYSILEKRANEDYLKVSIWTKQFLMLNLTKEENNQ